MKRYFIVKEYFGARVYDSLTKTEEYYTIEETKELERKLKNRYVEINNSRNGVLSSPLKISMNITKQCNLRCEQCFSNSGALQEKELTTDQIFRLFDQMHKYGTFFICIGGGEPLTRLDLLDILEYGKEKQLAISIVSNGLLLSKDYIEKLNSKELDTFWISLDGLEENHEKLRGRGTYAKALAALELLRDNFNGKRAIRITLNKYNLNEFKDLIKLAEDYQVNIIRITPLIPYGRAKGKGLEISQQEYIKFLNEIREIHSSVKVIFPGSSSKNRPWDCTNGFGCHCGKEAMWIDALGDCFPCYFWGQEYQIGNIKSERLIDVWNKSLKKSVIQGNDICKTCKNYKICRGGCRARVLYLFGNLDEIDPLCPLRKNKS